MAINPDFRDLFAAVATMYGDQSVAVIGRAHLVANKRAAGRPQDLLDAELLEGT